MAILSEIPGGGPTLDQATITDGIELLQGVRAYGNGGTLYTGGFDPVPVTYDITIINNSGNRIFVFYLQYVSQTFNFSSGNYLDDGETRVMPYAVFMKDSNGLFVFGEVDVVSPVNEIQASATDGNLNFHNASPWGNKFLYWTRVTQNATLTITPKT